VRLLQVQPLRTIDYRWQALHLYRSYYVGITRRVQVINTKKLPTGRKKRPRLHKQCSSSIVSVLRGVMQCSTFGYALSAGGRQWAKLPTAFERDDCVNSSLTLLCNYRDFFVTIITQWVTKPLVNTNIQNPGSTAGTALTVQWRCVGPFGEDD
jgi:hypothetical protein